MELSLEKELALHPDKIASDLKCVGKEVSLDPQEWLGDDKADPDFFDHYTQGTKYLDLLFWRNVRSPRLVLAEVKWTGGEADSGLMQLLDYYHLLGKDTRAQNRICSMVSGIDRHNPLKNAELYLIVGGYVSELLKKHVGYIREDLRKLIKIYQAIPQNKQDFRDWETRLVFPEESS